MGHVMYAMTDGVRALATPGAQGSCPVCQEAVRPKCGQVVTWHWAHAGRDDCDLWAERDTAWHRTWQEVVPDAWREIVVGNHRVDVLAHNGTFVELQHSTISVEEIKEREAFYDRMVWIFDAVDAYRNDRLDIRRRTGKSYVTFRWKHPRKTLGACRKPVLLDLGNNQLLNIGRIHLTSPCGGWGKLATRDDICAWLNTGSSVELSA
jgi:competence CoiA-like predicted nuclease